jgi:hypothetical protein
LNGPRARRAFRAIAVASVPGAAMTSFGAPTSDAATLRETSVNPYCESMIADHPSPPTNNSPIAYHAWAKQNLKYFEHLQSEANTSVAKSSLRVLVPILKVEAKSSNMKSLGTYIGTRQETWAPEWQDFDKTVVVCADWAVNLL